MNLFSLILLGFFLGTWSFGQVVNVPNLGNTYVDKNASGDSWALLGYGANGLLSSLLNATKGAVDITRKGSATLNSVNFAQQSKKFAISWNKTGFPTGGIQSYEYAVAFDLGSTSTFTFTAGASPPAGTEESNWSKISTDPSTVLVNLEVLKGVPNLPSKMYIRRETFGANYGNSYGLVNSSSNNQLDWSPDQQAFQVIYLGINANGYIAAGAGGTANGYTPSTMALWALMPEEANATVSGNINYDGVVPGPAYVWALEANGSKAAEVILPDGNGSFTLNVKKGRAYDFKAFIDGSGNGYPTTGEVWKHYGEWNSSLGGFNLIHVDGNLSGINFNLWDSDFDNDGFLNWHEYMAGTQENNASSTPDLDFGLVAHWKFDEINGTILHDSSGNDVNGTLIGFTKNSWSPGRSGGALRFDGVDDYVSFEGITTLDDIRPFSFAGWFKHDQNGSGYMIAKRSAGSGYWRFGGYESMAWIIRGGTSGNPSMTYNYRPPDFSWEHIVLTWSGFFGTAHMNIYHNGQLATNVTKQGGSGNVVSDSNNFLTLGNRPQNNSSYFKGWMDDFRLWKRVITPKEVESIYDAFPERNATVSGTVSYEGSVPGPVIVWAFNEKNAKVAQQILPNGPGQFSFNLPVGHSYDIKAFRDGNGNGSLDWSIGEPYAHWGVWKNDGYERVPVYGDQNGIDFAISIESDQDQDGYTLWEESQAGTSDQNASSMPNFAPIFQTDGNLTVTENQSYIFEFNATDPEGGNLTYAIEYGDDNQFFELNNTSGVLSFKTPRDFENPEDKNADNVYEFTASVSDGSNQRVLNLFVQVTDVNETNGTGSGSGGKGGEGGKEPLTDSNFQSAINLWFTAEANATDLFGHISDWNVSAVTNMSSAFKSRGSFNEDISRWDVSKVTRMDDMFKGASKFNQPIGNWDVSSVTSMFHMFSMATAFNQPIGNWDVGKVSAAYSMFWYASSFNQPLNNWDTSSMSNLTSMFWGAAAFNQDVSDWNITNATLMGNMFASTNSLSNANKGRIHISFSKNSKWPYDWREFVALDDSNFYSAINLWFENQADANATYGHISDWNVSAVTDMSNAFKNRSAFNDNIGGWDVSSVTNMQSIFNGATSFDQPIGEWDTSLVTNMKQMFQGAKEFNAPIASWDTSNVKNMWSMFNGASSFNQPIGDWNTSSVVLSAAMFGDATSFDQDISSWDLSNVTNLNAMFHGASSFNQDISNWDVSNATRLTYMFFNASSLNQDLSNWHIHPDANMTFMFNDNLALSDANKGLIHSTFSKNQNWPYDWSQYVVLPNSAPTDLNSSAPLSILENHPIGTIIGQFTANDPDENTTLTFTLVGKDNDNDFFSLDPNGTLRSVVIFDYESNSSYQIRLKVSDQYNLFVKQDFTVHILNVLEKGEGSVGTGDGNSTTDGTVPKLTLANHTIFENQPEGAIVGKISVEGYEQSKSLQYSLTSGKGSRSNDLFFVGPYNNLRARQSFDFEKDDRNMSVRVLAKGEGNASIEKRFSIFLLDDPSDDYNGTQPPYDDGNLTHDQNGTKPPLDDHNKTDDQNGTIDNPKEAPYGLPIVRTIDINQSEDGSYVFRGEILVNGGGEILETGFEISRSLFFRKSQLIPVELKENLIKLVLNEFEPDTRYYFRAYARNDLGVGKGTIKRLRTPSVPSPKTFWSRLEDVGDGWKTSSWFGSFLLQENQWAYHERLGWIYLPVEQQNGIWLWRDKGEWLWTSKESWPYLWKNKSGSWLYLLPDVGKKPIFYDFERSEFRKL